MPHTPPPSLAQTGGDKLREIAVVIVNYGTPDLSIEAVESVLERNHGGRDVHVHLVDNASPDDSARVFTDAHKARTWGDRVTLWLENENHGFGRGCNVVIHDLLKQPHPPFAVMLLNPDAQLENEAIAILADRLEADPALGFAGAGISTPDGEARVAAFRFPNAIGEFSSSLSFGPISRRLEKWHTALPPETPEGPVDWVSGAAVLIKTSTLRELKGFDPDFFLYYEEVDLMCRGARAGLGSRFVPEAKVIHIEGASTDVKSKRAQRKRMPAYRYQSWRLYFTKTRGRTGALGAALALLAGSAGNHVIAALRRKTPGVAPYFIGDFWSNVLKPLMFGAR